MTQQPFALLFLLCNIVPFHCSTVHPSTTPPSSIDLSPFLPSEWDSICNVTYGVSDDVSTKIGCDVTMGKLWRLADLRSALNESFVSSTGLEFAVDIHCSPGGTVSLPFPFRSPGLVKLKVHDCNLVDKWADFNTTAERLGDWLRVVDLHNCVWLNNPANLQHVLENTKLVTSHYDCGQDSTLVSYTYTNISNLDPDPCQYSQPAFDVINFTYPLDLGRLIDGDDELFDKFFEFAKQQGGLMEDCANEVASYRMITLNYGDLGDLLGNSSDLEPLEPLEPLEATTESPNREVVESFIKLIGINTECQYDRLQVLDESHSPILGTKHFEFLVEKATFPQLHTLNYSYTGLYRVPRELREWRTYFSGSKLSVIDLSHCLIETIDLIPPYENIDRVANTKLDLRFNLLSKITLQMVLDWALVPDFQIDIRHNPIDCTCDLKDLVSQLNNQSLFSRPSMRYYRRQMNELSCATPAKVSGRTISSLMVEDLSCPVVKGASAHDLRAPLAVMGVLVVLLLVVLVLVIRYRREVRILMYTRVNILLPCGGPKPPPGPSPEKTFDAFVAYAHQDSDWVLGTLLKKLENPSGNPKGRQPCKLCIHQRDFVVGKPIIDNIIDSIAASRHTVVVLSNSFVKSGWAMEELQQAYRQSLEERRRHLVVVLLEEVPDSDMGPVLRSCCKTFTYLHVSDSLFWDRLQYSIQIGDCKNNKSKNSGKNSESEKDEYVTDNDISSMEQGKRNNHETGEHERESSDFSKHDLFSEGMRTISVDSGCSTASVLTQEFPLSPDGIQVSMPQFSGQEKTSENL